MIVNYAGRKDAKRTIKQKSYKIRKLQIFKKRKFQSLFRLKGPLLFYLFCKNYVKSKNHFILNLQFFFLEKKFVKPKNELNLQKIRENKNVLNLQQKFRENKNIVKRNLHFSAKLSSLLKYHEYVSWMFMIYSKTSTPIFFKFSQ